MGLNNVFDISSFTMKKQQAWLDADVVNIHSYADFFSYLALGPLTETKPTVMTLHDMWSFTGHCYVSFDCERWKTGCGKCPYPDVYPPIRRDSTHIEWKLKNWAYRHAQLTVVAPSTAYAEFARQSMLGRFPVRHVPHGIDTACYEPLDRQQCRSLLGVPPDKKVLMFMAKSLHSSVKGGQVLTEVFRRLPRAIKDRLILLLVGNQGKMMADALGVQAIDCGYISNDRLKAICYSAADLFVHPTRAEAFGLVLLESMACGTPLVSFNVGGVSDLVRPGVTGYLAERDNAEDLMSGVVQLLTDESRCESMRAQCREIALREYCIELQAQRYASLYAELLAGSTRCSDETKSLPVASHTQTSDGSRPSV
jgi:glycosyltransferase involved in cell wall biosynthesis